MIYRLLTRTPHGTNEENLPNTDIFIGRFPRAEPSLENVAIDPYTLISGKDVDEAYLNYLCQYHDVLAKYCRSSQDSGASLFVVPKEYSAVSRFHLLLTFEHDRWYFEDYSKYGVVLKKARSDHNPQWYGKDGKHALGIGDSIYIGLEEALSDHDLTKKEIEQKVSEGAVICLTLLINPEPWDITQDLDMPIDAPTDNLFEPTRLSAQSSQWLINLLPEIYAGPLPSTAVNPDAASERWRYRPENFLDRFLAIFENTILPTRWMIDDFDMFLNPGTAPDDFLPWFEQWFPYFYREMGHSALQRSFIRSAQAIYARKGTKWALSRLLALYTGQKPRIIEPHDPEGHDLPPDTFRVIVVPSAAIEPAIRALIEACKPAHTRYDLRYALPDNSDR